MERREFVGSVCVFSMGFSGCVDGQGGRVTDSDNEDERTSTGGDTPETTENATVQREKSKDCPDKETRTYSPQGECPGYRLDDISIYNHNANISKSRLVIRQEWDGNTTVNETYVDPKGHINLKDPIRRPGTYTIQIYIDDVIRGEYEWEVPSDEDDTDAHGLEISIRNNNVEFFEVVA